MGNGAFSAGWVASISVTFTGPAPSAGRLSMKVARVCRSPCQHNCYSPYTRCFRVPRAGGRQEPAPRAHCPCPWHADKQRRVLEADAARRREEQARATRGICGVALRGGKGTCQSVRGECCFHAPEEVRCKSARDGDAERCYGRRVEGSDYCEGHKDYPNFGVGLRDYINECGGLRAFAGNYEALLHAFLETRYPGVCRQLMPDLAYVVQCFFPEAACA